MLSAQERKLLLETRDILEELLETEEVLRDEGLMKSIRDSREDVKTGRLHTIEQLKSKLRREGKL
jgi:hypothetical protein